MLNDDIFNNFRPARTLRNTAHVIALHLNSFLSRRRRKSAQPKEQTKYENGIFFHVFRVQRYEKIMSYELWVMSWVKKNLVMSNFLLTFAI